VGAVRRARLEAWIAEQLRAQGVGKTKDKEARTAEDFRREAEKQAAYTLQIELRIATRIDHEQQRTDRARDAQQQRSQIASQPVSDRFAVGR